MGVVQHHHPGRMQSLMTVEIYREPLVAPRRTIVLGMAEVYTVRLPVLISAMSSCVFQAHLSHLSIRFESSLSISDGRGSGR